jgi:hypothetical protein
LDGVAESEFAEYVIDMCVDCGFGDVELGRDFDVGAAVGDQAKTSSSRSESVSSWLEEEPAGADGVIGVLVEIKCGENHDARYGGPSGVQAARGSDAVESGHADVHVSTSAVRALAEAVD